MVLKLDPAVTIVWRSPESMQFGLEPSRVVLDGVTNAQERMIAALSAGISPSGLLMVARSAGAADDERESLLQALQPVLVAEDDPAPRAHPKVAVVGSGPTVEAIADFLAQNSLRPLVSRTPPDDVVDFAVPVGHWVLDPALYGFWLRRDIPHLPVVYGEHGVTVGPLVEPGRTACLYCVERHRHEADAAWPAIASQLWGRTAPTETALVAMEVAVRVARTVAGRLADGAAAGAASVYLTADTGRVVQRDWLPHPECGCGSVAAVSESQPGSGSAGGSARGARPPRPRRVRAVAAPA
ncbi:MAG: hypothetical protein JWR53_1365 [Glaciihabitans sp.]|nr:hypothetical protein [Glaciihabitans sp.]